MKSMKKNDLARLPGILVLERTVLFLVLTTFFCFVSLVQVSASKYSYGESSQQKNVTGKVMDAKGVSLPGVTVLIKGTTIGRITDSNGEFSLSNVPDNASLQFSFVGMRTKEIVVAGKSSFNVTMEEDAIGIEEVVAIGYGTMKKADLTG